jgi:hypothetical protein
MAQAIARSSSRTSTPPWILWLRHFGVKLGVYALFALGVYWIAAAYFAWNGELHWIVGPVGMALFGLILIALGWYLLGPETTAEIGKGSRELSPTERREQGFEHIWRGARWLLGGLAVTLFTWNLTALGGGKYLLCFGPILYGVSQIIRGAVQVYGPHRD